MLQPAPRTGHFLSGRQVSDHAWKPVPMSKHPSLKTAPPGLLLPAVLLLLMLVVSSLDSFRDLGDQHLENAGNRAVAAFAVARTINGVISVLQEVEVGVSAVVVETGFQPGQILDPLNDLIERFSNAALIAATILWSLKLAGGLLLSPWVPLGLLLLLALRLALEHCATCAGLGQLLMRFVRLGVVLWGFAAFTPWVIDGIHRSDVVQDHYRQASAEMAAAGQRLGALGEDDVWTIEEERIRETLVELKDMADRLSEQAIIVLAVFVFEVLMIPLAVFWISSRLMLSPRAP